MEDKRFSSFEIISEKVIIKRIDKSLLSYGEIRIPNYLRDFFYFHEMEKHDRWDIQLTYNKDIYYGVLYLDDYKKLRGKLRLGKDLTRELNHAAAKYVFDRYDMDVREENVPLLRIEQVRKKEYIADVIFPQEIMEDRSYLERDERERKMEEDPKIRLQVLKNHGLNCDICGFNYENTYGELGKGLIQIHCMQHGDGTKGNCEKEEDFIPICENCHILVHKLEGTGITLRELRDLVRFRKEIRKTKK